MSFNLGNKGEKIWYDHIKTSHTNIESAPNKKFYDWDLKGEVSGRVITYEVKFDNSGYYYARKRKKPVNLYIEFKNTNKDEDSGILASKATYYVYMLSNNDTIEIYVFDRLQLLQRLQGKGFIIKGNKTGGDNNALGWLPPLLELKDIILKKIVK